MEVTFELDTSPIGKLPAKWEKARKQGLFYNAQDMTRFLIQNTSNNSPKVRHGVLNKWSITDITDEQATIKSPAEYAYWVNYGHSQQPGRFIPGKWVGDRFNYDPKAKGGMVLKQPFVEGYHFVEKSFEQLQPLVVGNFLKALEEQE